MKKPSRYLPFKKAREYARSLGLSTQDDWIAFIRGEIPELGKKPSRIPDLPQKIYSRHEWLGYEDWLRKPSSWRPFKEAREYARTLGLKSSKEWKKFVKGKLPDLGTKPYDIPDSPSRIYMDKGWAEMSDWLGTPSRWRSFEEARQFARNLNLKSLSQWQRYCKGEFSDKEKRPDDIPAHPKRIYRHTGWISFFDWLGIEEKLLKYTAENLRPFEKAREFVQSLKLNNLTEWNAYSSGKLQEKGSRPADIPSSPQSIYKSTGWVSWGDWLGTNRIANAQKPFRSFKDARRFVRTLNLKDVKEWRKYYRGELTGIGKKPTDIPVCPHEAYLNEGWTNWGNFLGTGRVSLSIKKNTSFEKARDFARTLSLKTSYEWRKYCRGEFPGIKDMPADIPAYPQGIYRNRGWVSWSDFLGSDIKNYANAMHKPFKDARNFARTLNLRSSFEWRKYCNGEFPEKNKKPYDIPANPRRVYACKGWTSWKDFLDVRPAFRPFTEARKFVRDLNLLNIKEWRMYSNGAFMKKGRKPEDIPSCPSVVYRDKGWKSWGDFLGTGFVALSKKEFRSFEDARKFARSLNFKSSTEWRKYRKGKLESKGKKPDDIPTTPDVSYKNKGWKGWGDFLGTGNIAYSKIKRYSFEEARDFARTLNLKTRKEWECYYRGELLGKKEMLPHAIPKNPNAGYRDKGWKGWGDFLGTRRSGSQQ